MKLLDEVRAQLASWEHDLAERSNALHALADRAIEENRNFTSAEAKDVDRLRGECDELDDKVRDAKDRVRELESTQARTNAIADRPEIHVRGGVRRQANWDVHELARMSAGELRSAAMAVVERPGVEHVTERVQDRLDVLLRTSTDNCDGSYIARRMLITESDAYRSAWQRVMTNPHPVLTGEEASALRQLEELERLEKRGMTIGSDAAGGYGVPVMIDPTIILTSQGTAGMDIFQAARVETITNDEWKGVTSAGVSWSFDAEGATVSDDTPTLGQPTVTAHMARGFVPFSIELGMDYPNFAANMAGLLSEGYLELAAEKLTTGTGSGMPKGIVTALDADTTAEVTPTTDGAFGAADLYKLWDALPRRWRVKPSCGFMSSTDVQNEVRNFGTSMGSNFTTDLRDEAIPALFGRRYFANDFMDDFTATTGASNLLIVGDWKNFIIANRVGMNIELVPHLFDVTSNRPTGSRGWFAFARIGSDVATTKAFKLLQNQ